MKKSIRYILITMLLIAVVGGVIYGGIKLFPKFNNGLKKEKNTTATVTDAMADDTIEADTMTETTELADETSGSIEEVKESTKGECMHYGSEKMPEGYTAQGYEQVKANVEAVVGDYNFQGTILAAKGGEIVYTEAFGMADEENGVANTCYTRYGIASLTKSFTAAAIMQLRDKGLLSLDDTLDKYFPEFKDGSRINIRELLQMRSGIYDFLNDSDHFFVLPDSVATYTGFTDAGDLKGLDEYAWPREEMLGNIYANKLFFEPDERYSYSNTNYYLLGCIIEQVSGMSYEDYITENIFAPCGMSDSNMTVEEGDARGYIINEGFVNTNKDVIFSAGMIRSTVYDMYSWIRNLSEGNVVSKEDFAEMTDVTDVAVKNAAYDAKVQEKLKEEQGDEYVEPVVDPNVIPTYYGYGLMVTGDKIWHRGYIDGYASYMSVDIKDDVIIILLTDSSESKATWNIEGFWKVIDDSLH